MKLRLIVAWVVIAAGLASGQTFRGSIFGTVLDTKGTRVADANIKAVNVDTGMTRQTVTASDGRFSLSEVPIGTYDLVVTKDGFRILTTTSVPVRLGNPARVHVQLTPGEAARVMETPSNVPLTHVRSNNLGGTLGREVSDLPVNGRDFKKLLVLIPGVNADPSLVDNAPASPGIISVNGNRGRSNNFLLDGGDINDPFRNQPSFNENAVSGIPSTLLPLDSIDELSVMSNTNAQYGRNSGAIVNIVARSGANDLHGSIFGFFRNSRLDARNFFNFRRDPITGAFLKKDVFQDSQFGGSAGGAVTPGKTFWFLTYEGQRERAGIPSLAMVPSQEQIAANTPAGGRNPII
jgi:Carboxypeptidase regulatory-like domain/TonB-dependent Receptor Plug Domain